MVLGHQEFWIISKNLDFSLDKRGFRSIMDAIIEVKRGTATSKEGTLRAMTVSAD
jgi:hypothetical protein